MEWGLHSVRVHGKSFRSISRRHLVYSCVTRRAPCGSEVLKIRNKLDDWTHRDWSRWFLPPHLVRMLEKLKDGGVFGTAATISAIVTLLLQKRPSPGAGFGLQLESVSNIQLYNMCWRKKGATSFDLTFGVWAELKLNCQGVESEFSRVMQNSLYQVFVLTVLRIRRHGGAVASSSGLPKLCCLMFAFLSQT